MCCNENLIQNNPAVKKVFGPQEGHCEKRCEIQGGGQEMAWFMLMNASSWTMNWMIFSLAELPFGWLLT